MEELRKQFIKAIGLYFPFEVGKRTIVRRYVKKILNGSVKCKPDKIIVNRNGLKYDLSMCEEIDLWLYFTGWWEKADCQVAIKSLTKNCTIFDVGANIGSFALLAGKKIEAKGKVFAFEPNQNTLSKLKRNIAINDFDNISVINKALSDKIGEAQLFLPKSGKAGAASLHNEWLKSGGHLAGNDSYNSIPISTVTLDNFCRDNNIDNLDFIKIDVEGSEPAVLLGGQKTLKSLKSRLMLEYNEKALLAAGWKGAHFLELIWDMGYRTFKRKLLTTTLYPVTSEQHISGDCNLHCIPKRD